MNTSALEEPAMGGYGLSLRVKLVLSYLAVALGAIMLMIIVVAFAVQNYFYQSQVDQLNAETEALAQQLAQAYQTNGNSWTGISITFKTGMFSPYLSAPVVFVDAQGIPHSPYLSTDFLPYDATIQQALTQALHGQESSGKLQRCQRSRCFFRYLCLYPGQTERSDYRGALCRPAQSLSARLLAVRLSGEG